MELQKTVHKIFFQLSDSLNRLNSDQYVLPCQQLSGNTIGQHVRHIIEMYQCLELAYDTGVLDYETRKRDRAIETDKNMAIRLLDEIFQQISKPDKKMFLLSYYNDLNTEPEQITTNYLREIAYNIEHTIHHMALIRIGLREMGEYKIEDSYGVASSTLKFRKQCAQ